MNKVMALQDHQTDTQEKKFTPEQIEIIKNSICRGATEDEFKIFLFQCSKSNLCPFSKQIYAVKRKGRLPDGNFGETMTVQVSIDGLRLIADRTNKYSPGKESTYSFTKEGYLESATSYIKKLTKDGTWHDVSATAYYEEYCQKTKDGNPSNLWAKMPKVMLAKCAEALALRKAFPAETSGLYCKEEMDQADSQNAQITEIIITEEQFKEISSILQECDETYRKYVDNAIKENYKIDNLKYLPAHAYPRLKTSALDNMKKNFLRQQLITQQPEQTSEKLEA